MTGRLLLLSGDAGKGQVFSATAIFAPLMLRPVGLPEVVGLVSCTKAPFAALQEGSNPDTQKLLNVELGQKPREMGYNGNQRAHQHKQQDNPGCWTRKVQAVAETEAFLN